MCSFHMMPFVTIMAGDSSYHLFPMKKRIWEQNKRAKKKQGLKVDPTVSELLMYNWPPLGDFSGYNHNKYEGLTLNRSPVPTDQLVWLYEGRMDDNLLDRVIQRICSETILKFGRNIRSYSKFNANRWTICQFIFRDLRLRVVQSTGLQELAKELKRYKKVKICSIICFKGEIYSIHIIALRYNSEHNIAPTIH